MSVQNPFEAPAARVEAPMAPGLIDVGRCFAEAKDATFQNLGLCIGLLIVGGLVTLFAAVTVIGLFLVVPVLFWGLNRAYLRILDGGAEFGDLFSGFSRYGQALGSMLLLGIASMVASMIGNSVQWTGQLLDSSALSGIGSLIALAWSLGVVIRFYFSGFFIVDRDMGAGEAIQASWDATRGQGMRLVFLAILSGVVAAAGLLALGVGVLVSIPLATLMWTSAYRQLVPRRA